MPSCSSAISTRSEKSGASASDVQPTRLEAAKHKLHDLIARRNGARTALIAYAGSAHLVLPATDDPALLDSFVQALGTDLIARPGKNVAAVIEQAKRLLQAEKAPGTLLLITDGADTTQLDSLKALLPGSALQVLVLAVGSSNGGIIRDASGQPRTDSTGRPQLGSFDSAALKQLAGATDAPLGSLTLNNDDLDWVEGHAQQHFQAASDEQRELQWKDAGYWLCGPLLLMAWFSVRRGWSLNWNAVLLLGAGLALQWLFWQMGGLGPMAGKRARRASITRLVSSIDKVVWVTNANFSGFLTCRLATSFSSSTR